MMFNQTQRAFRMGMAQTDVLESGRIFTDMISREMEQIAPAYVDPLQVPPQRAMDGMNFWTELSGTVSTPTMQGLPGSSARRTNIIQRFFFLSRENNYWIGTGYAVIADNDTPNVGTLFRFSDRRHALNTTNIGLSDEFMLAIADAATRYSNNVPITNSTIARVADGIVHLRVIPFGVDGRPLFPFALRPQRRNLSVLLPNVSLPQAVLDTWADPLGALPEFAGYYFANAAVPASVELEVGVLEQNVLGRYRALAGNAEAQINYLSNRVGNVHIFRQRIPVRNVDFSVYP
jgi:hypothetical protein